MGLVKFYYCYMCAQKHKLPIKASGPDDSIVGYCYICGFAEPYLGHMTETELRDHGVKEIYYVDYVLEPGIDLIWAY